MGCLRPLYPVFLLPSFLVVFVLVLWCSGGFMRSLFWLPSALGPPSPSLLHFPPKLAYIVRLYICILEL